MWLEKSSGGLAKACSGWRAQRGSVYQKIVSNQNSEVHRLGGNNKLHAVQHDNSVQERQVPRPNTLAWLRRVSTLTSERTRKVEALRETKTMNSNSDGTKGSEM